MTVLSHQSLVAYARKYGLDWPHIGPNSVDLRLHPEIIQKTWIVPGQGAPIYPHRPRIKEEKIFLTQENPSITLYPGSFYLCSSVEQVFLAEDVCCKIMMRSSPARDGMTHHTAGLGDAGWHGQVTFEFVTFLPITLHLHQRVAQLTIETLDMPTDTPYTGKYKGQQGPTEAYQQ